MARAMHEDGLHTSLISAKHAHISTDAVFFAYSWKLPADSGAFFTVDSLSFLCLQLELLCSQL